jgi:chromo domain-containing protein 1
VKIEGSFYELYLIPNLSRLLRKQINVFNITFKADELAPHPHINRLFPHGQAILVTDSFLLLHPQEASRFLRWFRLQVQANKPVGTWKLCIRPGIRDLLLTIVEERSKEDGIAFMQMYESLYYIIPEENVVDEELEDDIDLDTDLEERTVRCMSSCVSNFDPSVGKNMTSHEVLNEDKVARNDATLVEWFAGWAMTQVESLRRFHVIAGARTGRWEMEKTEWERKWSHVSISHVFSFSEIKAAEGSPGKSDQKTHQHRISPFPIMRQSTDKCCILLQIEVMSPQTAFDKHKIATWEREFEKEKGKAKEKARVRTKGKAAGMKGEGSPLKISPTE